MGLCKKQETISHVVSRVEKYLREETFRGRRAHSELTFLAGPLDGWFFGCKCHLSFKTFMYLDEDYFSHFVGLSDKFSLTAFRICHAPLQKP